MNEPILDSDNFVKQIGPISLNGYEGSPTIYGCTFDTAKFCSHHYSSILATGLLSDKAVAKRQAEFVAGRLCVNRCFSQFGYTIAPVIKRGDRGNPQWPPSFTGSISHSKGAAIAILSRDAGIKGLGIDIEQLLTTKTMNDIVDMILTPDERASYNAYYVNQLDYETYCTLLFSAKEAIYKALYPIVQHFFDFSAVSLVELGEKKMVFRTDSKALPEFSNHTMLSVYHTKWAQHLLTLCSVSAEMADQIKSVGSISS